MKLDVCVISSNARFNLSLLFSIFPHQNIYVHVPKNLTDTSVTQLYNTNVIGAGGYNSMMHGRRWDSELFSKNGVSLALANEEILLQGSRMLLLLEEDFHIVNAHRLQMLITRFSARDFDLAVFGANLQSGNRVHMQAVDNELGWYHLGLGAYFFNTHAVLYSERGRRLVGQALRTEHLDMQIDSLYSVYAHTKNISVAVELKNSTVVQKRHTSSIQTDSCYVCRAKRTRHFWARAWHYMLATAFDAYAFSE